MELIIDIETEDRTLPSDLFESREFSAGQTERVIAKGISIRYEGGLIRRGLGFPDIVRITLVIAEDVILPLTVSIAAKWLYDKLKGRASNVMIEYTIVEIDEGEIKKVIVKKLSKN